MNTYHVINNMRVYNKASFIREDRLLIVNSMKCTVLDLARSLQLSDTNLSAILYTYVCIYTHTHFNNNIRVPTMYITYNAACSIRVRPLFRIVRRKNWKAFNDGDETIPLHARVHMLMCYGICIQTPLSVYGMAIER